MSRFFLAALVSVTTLFASSCAKSKEDAVPDLSQYEGTYTGKIGSGTTTPSGFFSVILKPGGKLDRKNEEGELIGDGTWEVSGEYFGAHYSNTGNSIEVTLTGKIDSSKKISGGWINTASKHGTYELSKQ